MNKFITQTKRGFTLDKTLVAILLILLAISCTAIYLSYPLLPGGLATAKDFVTKQIFWYVVGAGVVVFLLWSGVERLFTTAYVMYWVLMVFLLGLVLARFNIFRTSLTIPVHDTFAWYMIPGIGSFQPSEFMKIVLALITANVIHEHNLEKTDMSWSSDFHLIFKIARYALPALFLIFLQPDTGVPIVIFISLAIMFAVSGVRREWALILIFGSIFALGGIVILYYNFPDILNKLLGGGSTGYRLIRFYGWLDYEKYPLTHGYQVLRGLISMGTSGLTGNPLATTVIQFPEAQTDFIFAVITQNFGFIGATFAILMCFFLDAKLISNIIRSDLSRERYMMIGVVGMLVFQQFQNIGMLLALLPITGITLPFISYGGSSIVSYMIPLAVSFALFSEIENRHKH